LWCSSVLSHPLTAAATFLACSLACLTQPPKVARVFSFMPLKEAPQPLDTNLDQRLIRVGLLGLMLGCQHTSIWRDMAQHFACASLLARASYPCMAWFAQHTSALNCRGGRKTVRETEPARMEECHEQNNSNQQLGLRVAS
jgi:hypothetical protein